MKGIKKFFVFILVTTILIVSTNNVYAFQDISDVDIVGLLGMLKGEGEGLTEKYLEKRTTRLQAAVMFLRLNGLEEEALRYTGENTFTDANEVKWDEGRVILAYLKNHPRLGWNGYTKGEFKPNDVISSQEYTKVMLEALGYKQGKDFKWSQVIEFAYNKGITKSGSIEIFTNKDIATLTVETLKAKTKDGMKLVDKLVSEEVISQELAEYCGLWQCVIISEIESVVAHNSQVVEVKLKESLDYVNSSIFKIETDNRIIEVVSAELAPWDKDKRTALIYLENNLISGTLYSISCGDNKINFGGRSTDISKPTLSDVIGVDFNEIILEFSEPIRIDNMEIKVAEAYRETQQLDINKIEYVTNKIIKVITSPQKGSRLYTVTVSGVMDLANNEIKKDNKQNFAGIAKSTKYQVIKDATAIDYNKIYIEFETNIDPSYIDEATYKVYEANGQHREIDVFNASQASKAQAVEYDQTISTDTEKIQAIKRGIVITIDGIMDDSRLYKVQVNGLKTLYGKGMSLDKYDRETSFVGVEKPTGSFILDDYPIITLSATSLKVRFERKIQKDLAEDVDNYIIEKAYDREKALTVIDAELLDDERTVKLKVSEMDAVLYEFIPRNLKDIYGNSQETGSDIKETFVGRKKEEGISKVSIIRLDDKHIKLTFDANVGENATDVGLYTINNDVGYPEAVTRYIDQPKCVKLTIQKTVETKSYQLTVKGLKNADGVDMDYSNGVTGIFTGQGISTELPIIQNTFAINRQTLKISFDRDVNDATIKGVLWAKRSEDDVQPFFVIRPNKSNASCIRLDNLKAYQDPTDMNSLIIVDDDNTWDKNLFYKTYIMELASYYDNRYVKFYDNEPMMEIPASSRCYTHPTVLEAGGTDFRTVKVYFSKPVKSFDANDITIRRKSDNENIPVTKDPVPIIGTNNMEWYVSVDRDMYSTIYIATFKYSNIYDKYDTSIKLSEDEDKQEGRNVIFEFAGNSKKINYITDVVAFMPDNRTIEVYYPEHMLYNPSKIDNKVATSSNHQNVDNISSYLLRDKNGNNSLSGNVPNIKYIKYDELSSIATLYLDDDIDSIVSIFGLVINTNVANITGNRTIASKSSNNDALVIEVVNNKSYQDINRGPGIANAVVSGDRMNLQVTMDSVIAFGDSTHKVDDDNVYETIDNFINKTTNYTKNVHDHKRLEVTKDILKALKIVTTFVGGTEKKVVEADINKVYIGMDGKTLTFNFNRAIASGANGYVTTKTNDTTNNTDIYNYCMQKRSKTDFESRISFGAPNSGIFDYSPPILVRSECKVYDSNNDGKIERIEVAFNEEIRAVGELEDTLRLLTIGGKNELRNVQSLTINNNKIIINMKNNVVVNTDVVKLKFRFRSNKNTISDNNNNRVNGYLKLDIDSFIPQVLSISTDQTDGIYLTGEEIDIYVNFSEAVYVEGKPAIVLSDNIGEVEFSSSSRDNKSLIFTYIVKFGDSSRDLDIKKIKLNGGTIKDSMGNNANLEFTSNMFKNEYNIVVDTTVASIDSISVPNHVYKKDDIIKITVHFTDPVLISGKPQVQLDKVGLADYVSGTGSHNIVFEYKVKEADNFLDLDIKSINLNSGTIKTVNDNNADLSIPSEFKHIHDVVVDTTRPKITSIMIQDGEYKKNTIIPIRVEFSEIINVTNTPQITLSDGIGNVDYSTGTGTNTLTFIYTVYEGHNSSDLKVKNIIGIIKDEAENMIMKELPKQEFNVVIDTKVPNDND